MHYSWNYRTWVLPPGYQVVLSWFARDRAAFPGNAARFNILLSTLLCGLLFWLAARIHSRRAGLVAAAIGAVWLPQVSGAPFFFQEQLYLPLLTLAFALTVEAWCASRRGRCSRWPGVVFGFTALTRAMPLYFVPIAAAVFVLGSSEPPRGMAPCALVRRRVRRRRAPLRGVGSRWRTDSSS